MRVMDRAFISPYLININRAGPSRITLAKWDGIFAVLRTLMLAGSLMV
jgi:hypothetical protein